MTSCWCALISFFLLCSEVNAAAPWCHNSSWSLKVHGCSWKIVIWPNFQACFSTCLGPTHLFLESFVFCFGCHLFPRLKWTPKNWLQTKCDNKISDLGGEQHLYPGRCVLENSFLQAHVLSCRLETGATHLKKNWSIEKCSPETAMARGTRGEKQSGKHQKSFAYELHRCFLSGKPTELLRKQLDKLLKLGKLPLQRCTAV